MEKTDKETQVSQRWLTVNEAAAYLRLHRATFYRHYSEGQIPGYRLFGSGALRFKQEDLDALLVPDEGQGDEQGKGE